MLLLKILIAFNLVALLLNIRLSKGLSDFESFALNLLFLVSLYAVVRTSFHSIYILPLLLIPGYYYWLGLTLTFSLTDFLFKMITANAVWLLFVMMYYRPDSVILPNEDFIIYSRMGYYNDFFGVENTLTFYNFFQDTKQIDLYHFFEIWLMNLGNFMNGSGRLVNLFLFSYPVLGFLIVLGFKELLPDAKWIVAWLLLLLILLITGPYDFLLRDTLGLRAPMLGLTRILMAPKFLAVCPIVLYLISGLIKSRVNYLVVCLLVFYYPVTIPVVIGTLIVYHVYTLNFKQLKLMIVPVLLSIAFIAFSLINGTGDTLSTVGEFWRGFDFVRIGFVGFVAPVIVFGVLFI